MAFVSVEKDKDTTKTWTFNYTRFLAGRIITASEWVVPPDLILEQHGFTTVRTTVQVSGGTEGEEYECVNHVVFNDGDSDERTLKITIKEK